MTVSFLVEGTGLCSPPTWNDASLFHPTWGGYPRVVGWAIVVRMDDYTRTVTTRLKTARGHLDGIIRMVENDAWCPDVMKQLSAVQGTLESTSREVFRHHLETHVADAVTAGRGAEIVDELMEALKYDKRVMRPTPAAD
jgi:DNA-binding FrmR family transcriptional regulator